LLDDSNSVPQEFVAYIIAPRSWLA